MQDRSSSSTAHGGPEAAAAGGPQARPAGWADWLDLSALRTEALLLSTLAAPWGIEFPAVRAAPTWHLVLQGSAVLDVGDGQTLRLQAGDLVLLTGGGAHRLVSDFGVPPRPLAQTHRQRLGARGAALRWPGPGALAQLLSGSLRGADTQALLLLGQLPPLLAGAADPARRWPHADEPALPWLAALQAQIAEAARGDQPGALALLDALATQAVLRLLSDRLQQAVQAAALQPAAVVTAKATDPAAAKVAAKAAATLAAQVEGPPVRPVEGPVAAHAAATPRAPGAGRVPAPAPALARAPTSRAAPAHGTPTGLAAPGQWLAALADPPVARALACLHREPGSDWSLAALARQAGVSRSTLAARFTQRLGRPPMDYLARWRMLLAQARLSAGGCSVGAVAASLGYASEAAFCRAFRRQTGQTPGRLLQQATRAGLPGVAGGPGRVGRLDRLDRLDPD